MLIVIAVLAISWLVPSALAHGQGFGIYEHGACVMARGAAGVAAPCDDGSAIYVNPAGLIGREGVTFGSGGMLVFASGSFAGDTGPLAILDSGVSLVPHGYLVYGMSPTLALGVGLYAPYGLGIKWPLDFTGRFVSYDSTLKTVYVQPTAAYAVSDRVSIGGGLTLALSSIELNRREDLATVPVGTTGLSFDSLVDEQTDFANTMLSASGATGFGINVGALVKVNDRLDVGARYMTRVKLSYDGDATFTAVPDSYFVTKPNPLGLPVGAPLDTLVTQVLTSLPNQPASTELYMPAQFVIGGAVHATGRLTVLGDYQWVGWSVFDTVTLDFSNSSPPDEHLVQSYRDTSAARLGGEFETTPTLRLRAGYAYTQAAAPDETVTPLLPEARRNHFTVGVGWSPRPKMMVDLAYQFIAHADRRGRTVNPPPGERPTVGLNSGLYRLRGDLLGLTITFRP
jgi:long-chain fatty acid transport protein